jgi:hypothetical protein
MSVIWHQLRVTVCVTAAGHDSNVKTDVLLSQKKIGRMTMSATRHKQSGKKNGHESRDEKI